MHNLEQGGGLQIALGADIRYAAESCKLSVMESKWGLIPDMVSTILFYDIYSTCAVAAVSFRKSSLTKLFSLPVRVRL